MHIPQKNNLHFTTSPPKQFFPKIPHTDFSTKFRTNFSFIEIFTDGKPDTCATITQNSTHHVATLHTGHIAYIKVTITNEKPKYYQVNDINTLIHNVTHTYNPDITETIPHTNYSLQELNDSVPYHQFSIHQYYTTNSDAPPMTSPIYNVQPTSHTSIASFPFITIDYRKPQVHKKFNF